MIKIDSLKNTCKGPCIVVGHGESIFTFPWGKVEKIPKILVNFYEPQYDNIQGIVCWDKDIFKDVYLKRENTPNQIPFIFYSGCEIEQKADCFLEPKEFPPAIKQPVFSGCRAIYLAQYLGYEEIYLIGFDFIPHITSYHMAQDKEVVRQTYKDTNIKKELQTQIDAFDNILYIHDKIYQMNPRSLLNKFKYKSLGELCL